MPTIKNNFISGKMNLDVDERLIKKNEYRTASNIKIASSNSSDVGAIEKTLSNQKLSTLMLGQNATTVGGLTDEFEEKIYWLVKSLTGSYVIEYNILNGVTEIVLKDTRVNSVLNLQENFLVTGIVLVIDTDNNNRFLIFTDNNSEPKCINIDRAKGYGENGFELDDIVLIKKPPLNSPTIELLKEGVDQENNIEEKFIRFFTRFKYIDGEYSALSPSSGIAFLPKDFDYDYATSSNEGMINRYNKVNVTFDTGSKLVKEIELIFIESNNNTPYIVESYNKENKSWDDNQSYTVDFNNNKIYKTLSQQQLFRLFDGVPLKAQALEVINNILVFGNYTENWDLKQFDNSDVNLDINLSYVSDDKTDGEAYESNKSNRDYEVGLVYGETYGRHTTVLTSENNTAHIPVLKSDKKNTLQLTIGSKPPKFADWFRVFIKQNRYVHDNITSTLFYEDGVFVWVKLENFDADKINEGDYLIVKSDTQGVLRNVVKTKVLEIKVQDRNFLDVSESETLNQLPGKYFKTKATDYRLDIVDLKVYESVVNDRDGNSFGFVNSFVIYNPIYYGVDGLNDMSKSGTYNGSTDERYIIEIDDVLGDGTTTFNKFKWSKNGGGTFSAPVGITNGTPQLIENGVFVEFESKFNHKSNDSWVVSAKTRQPEGSGGSGVAYAYFPSLPYTEPTEPNSPTDVILAGARITFIYNEYNADVKKEELTFVSSQRYENLEEWYFNEDIESEFALRGFRTDWILFRRGEMIGGQIFINTIGGGRTIMFIRTIGVNNTFTDPNPKVAATLQIRQSDNKIIFETESVDVNSDIFYEIGRTYPIENGLHTSNDESDTDQGLSNDAFITLPSYNCFAWANGFESIKIKDLFNSNYFSIRTRPNSTIENFRKNTKIASLTYSQPYSQSLNYNGLNEFNLSQNNSKDIDDRFGSIQAIMEFNGNLDVYQEDKVLRLLYGKTVLYNQDGSSNVSKSDLILDSEVPYSGEFGIAKNPESLVKWGNYTYWVDAKRGYVLRKGQSGIEIISNFGMSDFFRDKLNNNKNPIFGGFDSYSKEYYITINTAEPVFDYDFSVNIINDDSFTLPGLLYLESETIIPTEIEVSYVWENVSNELPAEFRTSADNENTFVGALTNGTYFFKVTATDENGNIRQSGIQININKSNIYSGLMNLLVTDIEDLQDPCSRVQGRNTFAQINTTEIGGLIYENNGDLYDGRNNRYRLSVGAEEKFYSNIWNDEIVVSDFIIVVNNTGVITSKEFCQI